MPFLHLDVFGCYLGLLHTKNDLLGFSLHGGALLQRAPPRLLRGSFVAPQVQGETAEQTAAARS